MHSPSCERQQKFTHTNKVWRFYGLGDPKDLLKLSNNLKSIRVLTENCDQDYGLVSQFFPGNIKTSHRAALESALAK